MKCNLHLLSADDLSEHRGRQNDHTVKEDLISTTSEAESFDLSEPDSSDEVQRFSSESDEKAMSESKDMSESELNLDAEVPLGNLEEMNQTDQIVIEDFEATESPENMHKIVKVMIQIIMSSYQTNILFVLIMGKRSSSSKRFNVTFTEWNNVSSK